MSSLSDFLDIIEESNKNKPRQDSLIFGWLGKRCSHSLSIRLGLIIEKFINSQLGKKNILSSIDGGKFVFNGEHHQIDHLIQIEQGRIFTLETKLNTKLDRGKKRDIRHREKRIAQGLTEKFGCEVISYIFNPLSDKSYEEPCLGYVMGMQEFILKFQPSFTLIEFKALGKNPQIHTALDL